MSRNKFPEETRKLIIDVSLNLFLKNGYDHTSLQNIISGLGGLSKGAIYHHFKSKEEILDAVLHKVSASNHAYFNDLLGKKADTGLQTLKDIFAGVCVNPSVDEMVAIKNIVVQDPRFVIRQIEDSLQVVARCYIEPIIHEGIRDGSIKTEYPKQIAEVLMLLTNVWMNPLIIRSSEEDVCKKVDFIVYMLKSLGLDIIDDQLKQKFVEYIQMYCD